MPGKAGIGFREGKDKCVGMLQHELVLFTLIGDNAIQYFYVNDENMNKSSCGVLTAFIVYLSPLNLQTSKHGSLTMCFRAQSYN